jgi:nucleotide-binding universal stress UspA family protein
MRAPGPVLFCVDGSPIAQNALERACSLLAPEPAVALCVWLPAAVLHPRVLDALAELSNSAAEINAANDRAAGAVADAAAATARAAGFACTPRACRGDHTEWQEILEQADQLDASTIVIGSHGHSAAMERVIGGAAHRVLNQARRPVLMIPPTSFA